MKVGDKVFPWYCARCPREQLSVHASTKFCCPGCGSVVLTGNLPSGKVVSVEKTGFSVLIDGTTHASKQKDLIEETARMCPLCGRPSEGDLAIHMAEQCIKRHKAVEWLVRRELEREGQA